MCESILTNHVPLGHIFVELLPIVVAEKVIFKTTFFSEPSASFDKIL